MDGRQLTILQYIDTLTDHICFYLPIELLTDFIESSRVNIAV